MDLARLRNLGIAAHIDAGKTTLTESILVATGHEPRAGRVDEGTAVMDWMAEERERGITITAAATRVAWRDHDLNLIDTPGHVDFTLEVERCMRVLDGAVLVVDAQAGIQAQTETVFRQLRHHGLPALVFLNKLDRVGADPLAAVASVEERLGLPALLLQYPLVEESDDQERVVGVVDLLALEAWRWSGRKPERLGAVPAAVEEEAQVLREELLDRLADLDDGLLEARLEGRDPGPEALRAVVRRLCLAGAALPALSGVALSGLGVELLLDAVLDYLPSPLDRPPTQAHEAGTGDLAQVAPDPLGSPLALAFKTQVSGGEERTFLRVYRGTLVPGEALWNPRLGAEQGLGRLLRMHADHGEELGFVGPGDIAAATGLEATVSGDTLGPREGQLLLEPLEVPDPVMDLMVEPQGPDQAESLRRALERLAREDPSFRVEWSDDTGQWRVRGMGELHLEVALRRLEGEFGLSPRVGDPRVSYREKVRGQAVGLGSATRQVGEVALRCVVELRVSGVPGDEPPALSWEPDLGLSRPLLGALEEALRQAALTGPAHGYPLAGCRVHLLRVEPAEGAEGEAVSAPAVAQVAGQAAVQALRHALADPATGLELREPRMDLTVETPEEFAGGILADLGARHAQVSQVVSNGPSTTIRGTVALGSMLGYATAVRSLSQGRASHTLALRGFGPVGAEQVRARGL